MDDIKQRVKAEMKNPIREFLWERPGSLLAREEVEQWAGLVDQLQNPWVSVDDVVPEDFKTVLIAEGNQTHVGCYWDGEWIGFSNGVPYEIILPELWASLPSPPSKGGE